MKISIVLISSTGPYFKPLEPEQFSQRGRSRANDQAWLSVSLQQVRTCPPPHTLPGSDKPTQVYNAGLRKRLNGTYDYLKEESYFGYHRENSCLPPQTCGLCSTSLQIVNSSRTAKSPSITLFLFSNITINMKRYLMKIEYG